MCTGLFYSLIKFVSKIYLLNLSKKNVLIELIKILYLIK